jgi:hypothetical protein
MKSESLKLWNISMECIPCDRRYPWILWVNIDSTGLSPSTANEKSPVHSTRPSTLWVFGYSLRAAGRPWVMLIIHMTPSLESAWLSASSSQRLCMQIRNEFRTLLTPSERRKSRTRFRMWQSNLRPLHSVAGNTAVSCLISTRLTV